MIEWLSRNWGLKLISFVLAVGLWYYAVGEEGIEVTRSVPLQIDVKNAQMSIMRNPVKAVQVTFTAPRALLNELTSQEIKAVHEIGNEVTQAGEYSFRIEPREVHINSMQIRVLKIEPEVIQVTLDQMIVQKLAVTANFLGEPAFGFKISQDEIQLNPNAVLIEGPKGIMDKLQSLKTEAIDIVGRTRSFRRTAGLDLPPNIKLVSDTVIDVYIPIHEEYEEKKFENIPVKILQGPDKNQHIDVIPQKISFEVKGSKKEFEKLNPEKLLTYVDAAKLEPGDHDVPVEIILPENVSLKADKPPTVKVSVKK